MKEELIYEQLAHYIRAQYPGTIFHFDLSGVNNPSKASRARNSRLNGRGFPDLFIYRPNRHYAGLAIEVKTETARVFRKDGVPADDHIREQDALLVALERRGYVARFCRGFDECKNLIDEYMAVPVEASA